MMIPFSLFMIQIIPVFIAIFLGFFVFRHHPKKIENRLFLLACITLSLWSLFILIQNSFYVMLGHNYFYDIGFFMGLLSLTTFFYLYLIYPAPSIRLHWSIHSLMAFGFLFFSGVLLSGHAYLPTATPIHDQVFYPSFWGACYMIYSSLIILGILGIFAWKFWHNTYKPVRLQLLWTMLGFLICFFFVLIFLNLPISYGQNDLYYCIGYSSIIFVLLGTFIAISKAQAFHIKTALHLTLIWLIISSIAISPLALFFTKNYVAHLDVFSSLTSPQYFVVGMLRLVPSLVGLWLAFYVLFKHPKNTVNQLFFAHIFCMGMWALNILIQDHLYLILGNNFFYNLGIFFGATSIITGVILYLHYPGKRYLLPRLIEFTLIGIQLIFAVLALHGDLHLFPDIPVCRKDFRPSLIGIIYCYYSVFLLSLIPIVLIRKSYIETHSQVKTQINYIMLGVTSGIMVIFIFNLFPFTFGQSDLKSAVGYSAILFFTLGAYAAIAKAQAFNIKTVVHYTLGWALFSVISLITVTIGMGRIKEFLTQWPFVNLLLLFGVFCGYFKYIQPRIDHLFFRKKHQLSQRIMLFSKSIASSHSMQSLVKSIFSTLTETLYPQSIRLYFSDAGYISEYLSPTDYIRHPQHMILPAAAAGFTVIPIYTEQRSIGTMMLGEKKSFKAYSDTELQFLSDSADTIALHIDNIFLLDSVTTQTQLLLSTQNQVIETASRHARLQERERHTRDISRLITHEVKNTLYAITSLLDLLITKRFKSEDDRLNMIDQIHYQCCELSQFTHKYLTHLRVSLGVLRIDFSTVGLANMISSILTKYQACIVYRQMVISMTISDLLLIETDKEKLTIILDNLIHNAITHTPEQAKIMISADDTPTDTFIYIQDNGPAISTTLMDAFLDHAESPSTPLQSSSFFSTGFGLSICRTLIPLLGISITVEYYEGTLITLRLPKKEGLL